MFKHVMSCGVLVVGAVLFGVGCGNPVEAQQDELSSQEQQVGEFCGGFANIQCPAGLVCVDDPNDSCDPNQGGRDCGGICKKPKPTGCQDPDRTYVSHDPAQCAAIRFTCPAGKVPFFDNCGCGCEPAP